MDKLSQSLVELFIPDWNLEMARKRKGDEEGGARRRQAKVFSLGCFTKSTIYNELTFYRQPHNP